MENFEEILRKERPYRYVALCLVDDNPFFSHLSQHVSDFRFFLLVR